MAVTGFKVFGLLTILVRLPLQKRSLFQTVLDQKRIRHTHHEQVGSQFDQSSSAARVETEMMFRHFKRHITDSFIEGLGFLVNICSKQKSFEH